MGRLFKHICCVLVLVGGIDCGTALSQDRRFSLSASAGYGLLSLAAVDEENASDVAGWIVSGYPMSDFASVKKSPFFSARMSYRYTRDFGVTSSASYFSKTVYSSYAGPDATLQLERGVAATDLALGVCYYPALQPYLFQWYLQVNIGVLMARATAKAVGEVGTKPGGVVIMVPLAHSEAKYKKSRTSASFFVGADMPLYGGVFLKGEAGYRVAQMGQLDGDISRFGVQSTVTSSTVFNYSGVLLSVGVGIEL